MAERLTRNEQVVGSIPTISSTQPHPFSGAAFSVYSGGIVMKKTLCALLSVLLLCSLTLSCFAASNEPVQKTLRVISFNVDGLPIPTALSSTKRPVSTATKLIAEQVNAWDCDILCAQEDFNCHGTLRRNLDMPYATLTSGPAVVGDGLNVFSKFPIYNVGREAWEEAYGVFDCGSDELTPKGILYCTVEIADGVFVDVYNLHADAWEDEASMDAKAAQFDQLARLIAQNSADRAVILTGDFNTNYSIFRDGYKNGNYKVDLCQKLLDNFVNNGFKDAWIEYNNDGNYNFTYAEMYERYGCEYRRTWDTLDHVYYRDGAGVTFELQEAVYEDFDCEGITWQGHLSDHAAVCVTLGCTIDSASASALATLKKEVFNPIRYIFEGTAHVLRTIWVALVHIPKLIRDGFDWLK